MAGNIRNRNVRFYEEKEADRRACAKVTVSIENMNEIRRENFRQCDVKCAEWSKMTFLQKEY